MESWRIVFRDGFSKVLSTAGLIALREAIRTDDPRLVQGSTTIPRPLEVAETWPCEGACAMGLCGWLGDGLETIGEVEEFFAKACFEADLLVKSAGGCRWYLNWFDDVPRDVMRRELLAEVELELRRREVPAAAPLAGDAA